MREDDKEQKRGRDKRMTVKEERERDEKQQAHQRH